MGSSATNEQNAFHKLQSGWLGGINGGRVQTITATGDYTVGPLEPSTGTALLLIPNVTGGMLGQDFALDFRQPTGTSSTPTPRLERRRRRADPARAVAGHDQLADPDAADRREPPTTSTFCDAALASGQTFTDGTDQITIQTTSVSPFGATVHVTIGSVPARARAALDHRHHAADRGLGLTTTVSSGPAVTMSFGPATDAGGVASYRSRATVSRSRRSARPPRATSTGRPRPACHTYTVTATDIAGNVGPRHDGARAVPAPVIVTPTTPAPTTPTSRKRSDEQLGRLRRRHRRRDEDLQHIRLAKGVSLRALARNGRTRRVEVTGRRSPARAPTRCCGTASGRARRGAVTWPGPEGARRRAAQHDPRRLTAPENCSSSVEPVSARVELSPPEAAVASWSNHPAPTSRWWRVAV